MTEEDLNQNQEDTSNLGDGSDSEDSELADLFADTEGKETVSREEFDSLKKGVAKFFSEKGRKEKDKTVAEPKVTPNQSSDDVTELFLESRPDRKSVV